MFPFFNEINFSFSMKPWLLHLMKESFFWGCICLLFWVERCISRLHILFMLFVLCCITCLKRKCTSEFLLANTHKRAKMHKTIISMLATNL